jgi:hypothetical protein
MRCLGKIMGLTSYSRYVPGESIYGLVTNYHIGQAHVSWKETNKELFGCTHVRLHPVIPSHLSEISTIFNIDAQKLLINSTGYPLYAMALRGEANHLAKKMMADDGKQVSVSSRQNAFSLPLDKLMKYCPLCVKDDLTRLGKAIWWNEHQLYGVNYCPKHKVSLHALNAGEGGINRRYVLPMNGIALSNIENERSLFLSEFIVGLYRCLKNNDLKKDLTDYYHYWLDLRGYLTEKGNVRFKMLAPELFKYWEPIFISNNAHLPIELTQFSYIPRLVHSLEPMHYLKHVMLMAFLTQKPEQFFEGAFKNSHSNQVNLDSKKLLDENLIVSHLKSGCFMRQVAKLTGYSVGAIKQVALRNGIEIGRRRQRITADIERDIWRKAFVGMHRQIIADFHCISVGAVEQIIQSHSGLSAWRKHLRFQDKLYFHHNAILAFISLNSDYSRNKIKHECSSYMWLYKHDNEWLYSHLPQAQSSKYHPSVDWSVRDKILALKIEFMLTPCGSISALDRQLGGHHWLTKYASQLPLSMKAVQSKLI